MAMGLVRSREEDIEEKVFWQNHARYERFGLQGQLPSRSEILKQADDITRQIMEAVEEAVDYIFAEVGHGAFEFRQRMFRVVGGRCLLVTETGELGLGPISTQSGDVVAFIRNTKVPFILRKAQAGRYTLVGEAYIHGFMYGEILREGPPEFQEIFLE
jgi:hypothetical protein